MTRFRLANVFYPTDAECDMRRKARHERSTRETYLDRLETEQPVDNVTAAKERERLLDIAAVYGVPEHLRIGLVNYAVDGLLPGSFLLACIANDVHTAWMRADPDSRVGLGAVLGFVLLNIPDSARGTYERAREYAEDQQARRRRAIAASAEAKP